MTDRPATTRKAAAAKTAAKKAPPQGPAAASQDPPPPGITPDQMRLMHVLFRDRLGLVGREDVLDYLSVLTGRPVDSRKDLSITEAGDAIDHLQDPDLPIPKGPTVVEVIGDIKRQMRPVGKDQRNLDQGYAFRGISDVMDTLSPLMARYGLVYVPQAEDVTLTERTTRSGGTMIMAVSRYRWTIYGPSGDSIEAVTYGQGLDISDKSVNKAATAAEKYMLTQVFSIAFGREEADQTTPDLGHPDEQQPYAGMPSTPELLAMLDGYAQQVGTDREGITAKWRHENGDMDTHVLGSLHPTVLFPLVRDIRAWIEQQQAVTAEANPGGQ